MRYVQLMLVNLAIVGLMTVLSTATSAQEPTEHGTKQAGGLEITLLSAPPLSPEEMQRMMPGMSGMGGMQGMEGMMRGAEAQPTHWVGVIVRRAKDDRVVQGLNITLTAQKGELTRTVRLMPMRASYGANVSLPERGRYTVTVTIARPGQPVNVAFEFDYQ